jgi:hypothetical protein
MAAWGMEEGGMAPHGWRFLGSTAYVVHFRVSIWEKGSSSGNVWSFDTKISSRLGVQIHLAWADEGRECGI